ncbi:MAG: TetR/AcrR family transcriptional regulator [Candidatus Acidiferrales bacterium]
MLFDNLRPATRDRASESLSPGGRTRQTILAKAVKIAAREGLAALSIGRLAKELEMSKSGLFAHFHSKEALELATVERAKEVFENAILRPAQASGRGIERLWNLCDLWLLHVERRVFSGPYFFTGALFEFADRPGPVSEAIKNIVQDWLKALREAVEDSQNQKQLGRLLRAEQIALELNGILLGAHCAHLLDDRASPREARAILLGNLRELATKAIPASAFESPRVLKNYLEK